MIVVRSQKILLMRWSISVDLGAARNEDTREDATFYKKITEVRAALRGAEFDDAARGVDDR